MDSMMIGTNPVDPQSNFTGPNAIDLIALAEATSPKAMAAQVAEEYKALGHEAFWDRVYGKAPEGTVNPWDAEDEAEENGYAFPPVRAREAVKRFYEEV